MKIQPGPLIRIQADDNVAVALEPLSAGIELHVDGVRIVITEDIPKGHKVALTSIQDGQDIIKYGNTIGTATAMINCGSWVHTHNLRTRLAGLQEYAYEPTQTYAVQVTSQGYFHGFLREDGQVGIRNELWIIPTTGCVNEAAENLAALFSKQGKPEKVEGVYALTHPYGCSQLGDDHYNTQKMLAALAHHPNAAGVLILGLGCENNTIESLKKILGDFDPDRFRFMETQQVRDEVELGMRYLSELADYASRFGRKDVPLSSVCIGLKCGGSDGFSGITANPLLGAVTDQIIAMGGSAIMTEVPEMFGAEHLLMNRCVDEKVYNKCVAMINDFKRYYVNHGQPVYENPSPGNKAGGITTLEEKSLGCMQKGGNAPVVNVLKYGDRISAKGLHLLYGPGNDPVAVTALAAAGAQLVLFTTGRGTPLGGPVPNIKISSNSDLAHRKEHWIDFDAGPMLAGADLTGEFLAKIMDILSGREKTKAEMYGYHEIAIFKSGVTL